jgi:hypothetical protein
MKTSNAPFLLSFPNAHSHRFIGLFRKLFGPEKEEEEAARNLAK